MTPGQPGTPADERPEKTCSEPEFCVILYA